MATWHMRTLMHKALRPLFPCKPLTSCLADVCQLKDGSCLQMSAAAGLRQLLDELMPGNSCSGLVLALKSLASLPSGAVHLQLLSLQSSQGHCQCPATLQQIQSHCSIPHAFITCHRRQQQAASCNSSQQVLCWAPSLLLQCTNSFCNTDWLKQP